MTPDEKTELARQKQWADDFVRQAREKKQTSATGCIPSGGFPNVMSASYGGWSFCLDMYQHGSVEHWRMSAHCDPPGRVTTDEDWQRLGKLVFFVTDATGYPRSLREPEPIVPVNELPPGAIIHWTWHHDGSAVAFEFLHAMKEILKMTPSDPEKDELGVPKIGRNDRCPCGSGRKWKACHGGN